MKYWLFKTEPDVFSIDDLEREKISFWEGVRNYQARNYLRDEVKKGDLVLFYHSSTDPTGIVGVAEIVESRIPDPFQFDPNSKYFDPKSKKEDPRWFGVKLKLSKRFTNFLSLAELKTVKGLSKMVLVQKGSRLSIQPVQKSEFDTITKLGN
ncbi:EVE domain-containing protein [Leptospira ilyithenensis]|uniref:EVE domain-containing protein n=1 Tax=Leptospira ilyithenensis TaxID=2484901 RepID=A0A4R9LMN7_9LEPT|nr:EVE domain-containing protein [Leptospira ilyithenensis]TGN06481.1 EVE domain-containing protein [Leptospira ilyithenensis]